MAEFASTWFLRQLRGSVVLGRYHNHWPGRIITWESAAWAPLSFQPGTLAAGDVTAEGGATVSLPFDAVNWLRTREAQERGDFWELRQFRFDPAGTDDGPPATMTLWSGFIGQVVEVEMVGLAQVEVALGSVLAPVGVTIPFRTITTDLVGVPLRL